VSCTPSSACFWSDSLSVSLSTHTSAPCISSSWRTTTIRSAAPQPQPASSHNTTRPLLHFSLRRRNHAVSTFKSIYLDFSLRERPTFLGGAPQYFVIGGRSGSVCYDDVIITASYLNCF
jgi:hypothetical protein